MSIECAFFGFLARDADARTGQAGNPWVRLSIGAAKTTQCNGCKSLSSARPPKAAELKKSDRCYIEGTIKLNSWTGNDGAERNGLSVATCEPMQRIGRNKPDRNKKECDFARPPVTNSGAEFDDEIQL